MTHKRKKPAPGAARAPEIDCLLGGDNSWEDNKPILNAQYPLTDYSVDQFLRVEPIRHSRPSRKLIDLAFRGFAP